MNRREILEKLHTDAWEETLILLSEECLGKTGTRDTNTYIHTTFSFSPYSHSAAVYFAKKAGLCTCGIIDHDSIGGAAEFVRAAEIMDIAPTVGMEIRVSYRGTAFEDKKINNPDQKGLAYMLIHGVPHKRQMNSIT